MEEAKNTMKFSVISHKLSNICSETSLGDKLSLCGETRVKAELLAWTDGVKMAQRVAAVAAVCSSLKKNDDRDAQIEVWHYCCPKRSMLDDKRPRHAKKKPHIVQQISLCFNKILRKTNKYKTSLVS